MDGELIERGVYLGKLAPLMWNRRVKVVKGFRRCGKSSIVSMFLKRYPKYIKVVNLNMVIPRYRMISDVETFESILSAECGNLEKAVIVIEEPQRILGWESAVRKYAGNERFDVYVTMSAIESLGFESRSVLSGMVDEITVYTMSCSECIQFSKDGAFADCSREMIIDRYCKVGGMPMLWSHAFSEHEAWRLIRDTV